MNLSECIKKAALGAGLKRAAEAEIYFGEKNGFLIQLAVENASENTMKIITSAKRENDLTDEEKKSLKEKYPVKKFKQDDTTYAFVIKNDLLFTDKFAEKVSAMINGIMGDFAAMGFVPCCQNCKENKKLWPYYIGGFSAIYCDECGAKAFEEAKNLQAAENAKPENVLMGIIGALIGAVAGGLLVILFTKAGKIAALSGAVTMWLSLMLYNKFSRKLSVKGIAVSALFSIAAIAAGFYFGFIWAVAGESHTSFELVKNMLPELIKNEPEVKSEIVKNLALLMVFAVIGAFPVVKRMNISADEKATVTKLTAENGSSFDEIKE